MRIGAIQGAIIDELAGGAVQKMQLRGAVASKLSVSFQAYYKALADLRTEEVVTVTEDSIGLSIIYIEHEKQRLERIKKGYHISEVNTLGIKEDSKQIYRFKTLGDLELFWTHAVLLTAQAEKDNAVLLSFLPHYWFTLLKPTTSNIWFQITGKRNIHARVFTHIEEAEKRLIRSLPAEKAENMFSVNPLGQEENLYVNIIGDYIFQASIDKSLLPLLRSVSVGEEVDVQGLMAQKGNFRLTIKKGKAASASMRQKAQKYFSVRL